MLNGMISVASYANRLTPWLAACRSSWQRSPLAWAFCLSLAIHCFVFSSVEIGHRRGWWVSHPPSHGRKTASVSRAKTLAEKAKNQARQPARAQEPPLLFVEVDPAVATPEPPKEAKFYSSQNSQAANPDARVELNQPKIEGTQMNVVKTTTTKPLLNPQPLQPTVVATPPKSPPKPSSEPRPQPTPARTLASQPPSQTAQPAGDLAVGNPSPQPRSGQIQPRTVVTDASSGAAARPRTLAAAREQRASLGGEAMQQEGGVRTLGLQSSLDVKASPFGNYDAAFIAAVKHRWFDLIEEYGYGRTTSGKVVLVFRLHYNGKISDMNLEETTAGELLALVCQRAILDNSPYRAWPSELRRVQQLDYRDIKFTFFYN